MRRWLSGIVGVVVLVGASSGAALAAPAQEDDGGDNGDRGGGGELRYQETIDSAIADIQAFWDETLPDAYQIEYRELRDDQIVPYDEDTPERDLPACGEEGVTYEDVADNAFYCVLGADEEEDFVAYDDGGLFPRLFEDFGPFALVQVLAHEWGHAIQGQTLTFDQFVTAQSIQKELQSDCFAGAYVDWVREGESTVGFQLDAGDLETGLAGMLEFKDPAGTDPTEQGAHGNGFDRANAFAEGIEQGPLRCVQYADPALLPTVTEIPFTSEEDLANEGNLPLDEAIRFGTQDLDLYWEAVFEVNELTYDGVDDVDGYDVRRRSALPECEALDLDPDRPKKYRGQVFYCPGEDFIAYDEDLIAAAHREIGDFAAMLLIGNAWAAGMQDDLELEGAALQADCFGGAWAGSIPLDVDGDTQPDVAARGGDVLRESEILLSPGDLDEVVAAFLAFSEPSTEDGDEFSAFERLASFRDGFFSATAEEDCSNVTE